MFKIHFLPSEKMDISIFIKVFFRQFSSQKKEAKPVSLKSQAVRSIIGNGIGIEKETVFIKINGTGERNFVFAAMELLKGRFVCLI